MTAPYVTLAVALVVLVASAGACRRELDGPVPTPVEYGAAALPDDATASGVDAVYARSFGTECQRLVNLRGDGTALTIEQCGALSLERLASDPDGWALEQSGDYAYRDGTLWVRVVEWDWLAGEFVFHEWDVTYCTTAFSGSEQQTPGDTITAEFELVNGSGPPDAAPCRLG
jgi:hypothetical protein